MDLKKIGSKLFGMYKTFHKHEDSRGIGLFITKNQIETRSGGLLEGVRFSDPVFKGDEVSIEVTAEVK